MSCINVLTDILKWARRRSGSPEWSDQLHYLHTASLIGLLTLAASAARYVSAPIQCWMPSTFSSSWEVIYRALSGAEWRCADVFPRIAFCEFEVLDVDVIRKYTLQCVLPVNSYNEKIFIFLWFWFLFVAITTAIDFLYSSLHMTLALMREKSIRQWLGRVIRESDDDPDRRMQAVKRFCHEALHSDGVLALRFVESYAGGIVVRDLATKLYADFLDIEPHSSDVESQLQMDSLLWREVAGYDSVKLELEQAVLEPLRVPLPFSRFGVDPPSGILLYGPPGCSKTLIARAIARESHMNFLSVNGPELFSKWVGDSEKAIRDLFARARQVAPTIVFFDEIDAVGSARGSYQSCGVGDRVLTELDGLEKQSGVLLLATTTRPDRLDSALLRPGRLDRMIYVDLPSATTRKAILLMRTARMRLAENVRLDRIVRQIQGYSSAEIVAVCQQAGLIAMRENSEEQHVAKQHFAAALENVLPRTDYRLIHIYEGFRHGGQQEQG